MDFFLFGIRIANLFRNYLPHIIPLLDIIKASTQTSTYLRTDIRLSIKLILPY